MLRKYLILFNNLLFRKMEKRSAFRQFHASELMQVTQMARMAEGAVLFCPTVFVSSTHIDFRAHDTRTAHHCIELGACDVAGQGGATAIGCCNQPCAADDFQRIAQATRNFAHSFNGVVSDIDDAELNSPAPRHFKRQLPAMLYQSSASQPGLGRLSIMVVGSLPIRVVGRVLDLHGFNLRQV